MENNKDKASKPTLKVEVEMIKNSIAAFAEDVNKGDVFSSYSYNKLKSKTDIEVEKLMDKNKVKDLLVDDFVCNYIDCSTLEKEKKEEMTSYLNKLVKEK